MGVYYAATALEGKICRGATVIVVGSGNSAGQAAMFLSDGAAKVLLVVRGGDLAKMSTYLSRRVTKQKNIEILYHTQIRKLTGNKMLEEAELENTKTGERRIVQTPAIFSMIGANPCTEWLPPEIERDEKGFIKTGTEVTNTPGWKENKRKPAALETSVPNIFAAGDVRSGSIKRCAAAVGEGGMAIAGVQTALAASAERT
jgi:thioredoxin reductase (NADPH)